MRIRAMTIIALAATVALAASCSDSDDDASSAEPATVATTGASGTAGTSSASGSTTSSPELATAPSSAERGTAFPVTIRHAFGETTVPAAPQRVVAWGWGSADAAIAVGVVPVAIPFQGYGGDDQGVLPWIRAALDATGAELPAVLPNTDEVPFEAIAAAKPDLILAAYSGITESDYDLLSQIAPTVAYPGQAWSTPWRELIEMVGTALGRSDAATAVLDDIDAQVAAQAAAHPELAGKTVAAVWDAAGTFYVYEPADPRVQFMLDLGMVSAPSVEELSTGESTFYFTLSYEQLGSLTSDVLVSYADTPALSEEFLTSDHAALLPQVAAGRVAAVTGEDFVASVSPPTALSLTWGLDEYVTLLAAAATGAGAGS
jgi:iron complex transport system substrate-binding protein